jgi:ABC-2 family transporter protein
MIWVTWRQHRAQLLFGTATLGALGTLLLVTGLGIFSSFRTSGLASCLASPGSDCSQLSNLFLARYSSLQFVAALFLMLPALLGLFWGAPLLAREVEHGTHRLAWTQSISRSRWLSAKLAVLAGASIVGAAVMGWGLSWWSRPFVTASDDRFSPGIFDVRGIAPLGYALFALALGVAAGAFIRRTLPAMAASLAGFAVVRVAIDLWVRRHYMAPKVLSFPILGQSPRTGMGDWVISTRSVDASGHLLGAHGGLDFGVLTGRCPGVFPANGAFPDKTAVAACLQRVGARTVSIYQPGGRYWAFQGIEVGIFVVLAAGLFALSVWWVRRRIN